METVGRLHQRSILVEPPLFMPQPAQDLICFASEHMLPSGFSSFTFQTSHNKALGKAQRVSGLLKRFSMFSSTRLVFSAYLQFWTALVLDMVQLFAVNESHLEALDP